MFRKTLLAVAAVAALGFGALGGASDASAHGPRGGYYGGGPSYSRGYGQGHGGYYRGGHGGYPGHSRGYYSRGYVPYHGYGGYGGRGGYGYGSPRGYYGGSGITFSIGF
jgi:hypothetical protein